MDITKYLNPDLISAYLTKYGLSVVGAIAIFVLGRFAAKAVSNSVRKVLRKSRMDETLVAFSGNVLFFLIMALVIVASLGQLGVETTTVAAVFAAAGLAVGLALQNSLSNFASGVLIIALRPFKSGDYITAGGQSGTVEEVNIFTTHLRTPDNIGVVVPNSSITAGSILNYNANKTRRMDMVFGISYQDDIVRAKSIILDILGKDTRILPDPAPVVGVLALGESSVDIAVRPWVKTELYWDTWFDLHETIKLRFDAEGITIPFPQRDVILHELKPSGDAPKQASSR